MARFLCIALVGLLVLTGATSGVIACLPGSVAGPADMTAGEMDMHDCGPAVMPDCCVTTASVDGLQALIPASAHRLDSPLALLAGPVVTIATASARSSVGGPLLLAAPSPPSFFLASALRI